jgi:hypothetical protein
LSRRSRHAVAGERLCVKLCLITIIILAGRKGRNVHDMEILHDAIGSEGGTLREGWRK